MVICDKDQDLTNAHNFTFLFLKLINYPITRTKANKIYTKDKTEPQHTGISIILSLVYMINNCQDLEKV